MIKKTYYIPQEERTYEITEDAVASAPSRVLLLEDDEDLTALLAKALETISCATTIVTNGADGLRQIMANDFDVIVCDMVMPKLPGDMFYLAVERTRPHLCRRFIFMTGHTADKRWDEFARSKGCLILWKPFELSVFLEAVQGVISKNSQTTAKAVAA